jgi:phospholipase C
VTIARRRFLELAVGGLAAAGLAVVDEAFRTDPLTSAGRASLRDVEHFVLLMQENRSFDHYFGTMSGVRGFGDGGPVIRQRGYQPGVGPSPDGVLLPFRLETRATGRVDTDVIGDPDHGWHTQHACWHRGALDAWMTTHLAVDAPAVAPAVMGYYTRPDIPAHFALADAFTICDHYFCSALGPTGPNRLLWMTGTIDPEGRAGGPVIDSNLRRAGRPFTWRTFPEVLHVAGISWKIYNEAPAARQGALTGIVRHFKAFQDTGSPLYQRGIAPRYPHEFEADVAAGALPAVSWIIPAARHSEHPSYPPEIGATSIIRVLAALVANPAVWERTALIVSYDENGGLFDHVSPPVPPAGTPGEFLTRPVSGAAPDEPIGLGFRVPCLVLSPFTRGGFVNSDTFDHTSQMRLIAARFGIEAPNVSPWRRRISGDMTSLWAGHAPFDASVPPLPRLRDASLDSLAGDATPVPGWMHRPLPPYPLVPDEPPRQARWPRRRRLA